MKKILTVLMAMIMVTALAGCAQTTTTEAESTTTVVVTEAMTESATAVETTDAPVVENNYPMTLTDKYGNEIVIEEQPQRIISMSPELTETLYALGAADKMIGRSSYCNFPAEATEVKDFGTLFDLNIESIVAAVDSSCEPS